MRAANNQRKYRKKPLPYHIKDHNYSNYGDPPFTLDQQCDIDLGWASISHHVLDNSETTTTEKLKQENLHINQSKTEKYHIKNGGDESLKKCKYVGSLLGTTGDIERRK